MATSTPISPIAIATATLEKPWDATLVFYEEHNTQTWKADRRLWYNADGRPLKELKETTDWSLVPAANAATTIIKNGEAPDNIPNTASFLFQTVAPESSGVAKFTYSQEAQGKKVIEEKVVELKPVPGASVSSSTTLPKSTTSDDKLTASQTNIAPSLVSSASTPLNSTEPTATSSSPVPSRTVTPSNDGLSGGAVAGVAVGCLLAGALIAGLLAWFCFKRRKPASGARDSEASTVALMHREKGPVAKTVSLSSGSPIASALENGLPQPLEDKAISGEISKISNLIKNHVQSYYHIRAVSPGLIDYDDLQALGDNSPVSVGTLSTLLNNPSTREVALRFCIASVVTSRIRPNDSSNTTFLPPEVAKCVQSMNQQGHTSRMHSVFYTKWRMLTAELLQSSYVRNPFSTDDGRVRNIQAAAALLDNVLRPFADTRMDNGARSRNLEEILKRSAQFALTLFSQPTAWDFDWQTEHSVKSGSICIFPALVQVTDENGEPIDPPRPFSEPVHRRLDE